MKIHELASEVDQSTKDVIAFLNERLEEGAEPITSHMVGATDEQADAVRVHFFPSKDDVIDDDASISYSELEEKCARLEHLSEQQEAEVAELEQKVAELEEKLKAKGSEAKDEVVKADDSSRRAIREKLTKGMNKSEVEKITTDLRCKGTISEYWDKYSGLVL